MSKAQVLYPIFIVLLTVSALALVKYWHLSYPVDVTTSPTAKEFAVSGEGKVEVTPDLAQVSAGATVNNLPDVAAVQVELDKINNAILVALGQLGVAKKDIQTSSYSIYPNYNYDNGKSVITGNNGSVTITIKVRDLSLVSKVLSEAAAAGANQINGVSFTVENPDSFRQQARQKAIDSARSQALSLSSSLGLRLGRITNLVEATSGTTFPLQQQGTAMMGAGGGGGGPVVEPGSQTVSSTVTLYFEKL